MAKKHNYITPEFQMVLAIVRNILWNTKQSLPVLNIDNTKLLQLIMRNNLSAYIAANINSFPELQEIKIPLQKKAKRALAKNLMLQADLLKVIDLTRENNIHLVLFKGHPVNEMIYGNNNVRTSTDVDICILPKDLPVLEKLLVEKGFSIDTPNFNLNDKEYELFLKIENEKSYFSPSKSKLDVHFKLFKNPYLLHLPSQPSDYLLREKYCGRPIYRMKNDYTLLYLMLHGRLHGWDKMMWLIDIVVFLKQISIEELNSTYELAKKNKIDTIFLGTLSLCNVAFEMPIPKGFDDKIKNAHAGYVIDGLKSMSGQIPSKLKQWEQRVFMKRDAKFFLYQLSIFPIRDLNIVKIPFGKRLLYPIVRPITKLLS